MVDVDKIIELGKMGYSKEEIKEMLNPTQEATKVTDEKVVTYNVEGNDDATDTSKVADEQASQPTSLAEQLEALKAKMVAEAKGEVGKYIDEVKKDIQTLNIFTTSMNGVEPTSVPMEDLIGKIIAPPNKQKEGE